MMPAFMAKLTSINPATLEPVGEVEIWDKAKVDKAVAKAWQAFERWGRSSFKERAKLLLRARSAFCERQNEFAELITKENGKPLIESYLSDMFVALDCMSYFAANTEKLLAPQKINIGPYALARRK